MKIFIKYLFIWITVVLCQVLICNNIQLFGYINPYIYIIFILLLPLKTSKYLVLLLGFLLGLSIDIFSNTPGIHASATTFMAFLRPYIINILFNRESIDKKHLPSISSMGLSWFIKYTVIMVLVHHLFLFYIEAFSFTNFFFTLTRCLSSAVFSIILLIISQLLFFKERQK
ncbi:MAG: rod shape-determining protein MreD [Prolixibacteraceae bacterium]|nr:rod shape-determining protein MreD [Prolixibacteraceae bacterium]